MAYQRMRVTMSKNPVVYARVSTDKQTVEQQVSACRRLLGEGEEAVVLSETKSGWDTDGRVEYQRLREMIRSGAVSSVVCYKLDRLGRNAREIFDFVCDCVDRAVAVQSVSDKLDTATPMGLAMVLLMGTFAQLERDAIKERTRAKFAHYRESYGYLGHGSLPGWFSQSAITKEPAVRALAGQGFKKHVIARQLGLDPRTVGRILKAKPGTLRTKQQLHAEHPGWYQTPAQQREEFAKLARQGKTPEEVRLARQTARQAKPGA